MNTLITIDKAGRIVIPKKLRDEWGLEAGGSLELASEGNSATLRPVETHGRLRKRNGFWEFHSEGPPPSPSIVNEVLNAIRDERDRLSRGEDE